MLLEAALTMLVLACISCIACILYSKLLFPQTAGETWAVIWGFDCGEGLEQRVRSLMWLRSCGLLRCAVVVADGGLNEDGRALAVRLAGRYPGLTLCSPGELERLSEL